MKYDPAWVSWVNRHGYDLARPFPTKVFLCQATLDELNLREMRPIDVVFNVFGTNVGVHVTDKVMPGHLLVRMTNGDFKVLGLNEARES